MLNGLDLFSGIGGLSLALAPWVRPIAYCESDRYAQAVLLSRMHDRGLPTAPIWDNVSTLRVTDIPFPIDIIYGGFPCQDISTAGTGKGLDGKRSGLFFEVMRLAKEIQPKFIFLENVPAIRTRGLDVVGQQLADAGYDCRWCSVSAAEIRAPHIRERWFLLAYSASDRWEKDGSPEPRPSSETEYYKHWESEPDVGRVVNGVSFRVDRIKGLGNAVVPQQAQLAFKMLMGLT